MIFSLSCLVNRMVLSKFVHFDTDVLITHNKDKSINNIFFSFWIDVGIKIMLVFHFFFCNIRNFHTTWSHNGNITNKITCMHTSCVYTIQEILLNTINFKLFGPWLRFEMIKNKNLFITAILNLAKDILIVLAISKHVTRLKVHLVSAWIWHIAIK